MNYDATDKLIDALRDDLSDRNGLDWYGLDDAVIKEIRADWRRIIQAHAPSLQVKPACTYEGPDEEEE